MKKGVVFLDGNKGIYLKYSEAADWNRYFPSPALELVDKDQLPSELKSAKDKFWGHKVASLKLDEFRAITLISCVRSPITSNCQ